MGNLRVTKPLDLSGAITYSSINEPDSATGEVEWVSGGTYKKGDKVIVSAVHRKYAAYGDIPAGRTVRPDADPTYWNDIGATNKYALIDSSTLTQSTGAAGMTYKFKPDGAFNSIHGYNVAAQSIVITVRSSSTGAVVFTKTLDMIEPPRDWWEADWGALRYINQFSVLGIPPVWDGELEMVLGATNCGIGHIIIGDAIDLVSEGRGVQSGVEVQLVDESQYIQDDYGNKKIGTKLIGTDLNFSAEMSGEDTTYFFYTLKDVLGVACAWQILADDKYNWMNVCGTASGPISCRVNNAVANLKIAGIK